MAASPDAILHLVALHALAQAGFASTSRAASVTLTGVVSRYLSVVAASCTERAALAGRSKVAAIDVVLALEDLGVGGVTELQEWTADLDKEVTFTGGKLDDLAGYLHEGLAVNEGVEANFVEIDSDEEDEEMEVGDEEKVDEEGVRGEDEGEEGLRTERAASVGKEAVEKAVVVKEDSEVVAKEGTAEGTKEEAAGETDRDTMVMDEPVAEVKTEPRVEYDLRVNYRPRSPDLSWLPPLPNGQTRSIVGADAVTPADTVPAPQSVAERYRRPVAYATSQLAEANQFSDPPRPSKMPRLPSTPTSFPSLLTAYTATVAEPSVALRQTDGRRQAADILRLTAAPPDAFSPRDTLAIPLPPPHVSPVIPPHSEAMPTRLLPVNPNPNGVVTSILHQMRSAYLPPVLRERLTSLRPPIAQTREKNSEDWILYGDPVRGADEAQLAKARGKATGNEAQAFFRATWDIGPRGQERWGRPLPTGKRVARMVEGAVAPREAGAATQPLKLKLASAPEGREPSPGPGASPASAGGIKLRLGGPKSAVTPSVPPANSPSPTASLFPPRPAGSRGNSAPTLQSVDGVSPRPYGSAPPAAMARTGSSSSRASHGSHGSQGKQRSKSRSVSPNKWGSVPVKQERMTID